MPTQLPLWDTSDSEKSAPIGNQSQARPDLDGVSNGRFPQLLKWIGNKHRFAHEIASFFPSEFGTYYEPFLGSGAVLGTLVPRRAVASDAFPPLMEIWTALKESPAVVKEWYAERWERMRQGEKKAAYEAVKASYNARPNGADLLFLCRACYGGVVRFRQADGYMSTPCGPHAPISPDSFSRRVDLWAERIVGAEIRLGSFEEALSSTRAGDLVYCDPPYSRTQSILYGAQRFDLALLLATISRLKLKGVLVALSIDGTKRSGETVCNVPVPHGLFEREVQIDCGRSMLRRFQMKDRSVAGEDVADRLLLTW